MDKYKHKGRKENSNAEQKLANQNNSFPLFPYQSNIKSK